MRLLFRRFNRHGVQLRTLVNLHHPYRSGLAPREVSNTLHTFIRRGNIRTTSTTTATITMGQQPQPCHNFVSYATTRFCSTSSNGKNKNDKDMSKDVMNAKNDRTSNGEKGALTHATSAETTTSVPSGRSRSSSSSTAVRAESSSADATEAVDASHPGGVKDVPTSSSTRVTEALRSVNHTYEELEMNLMHRLHESNKNRFRSYLIGTILLLLWIISVFGDRIRKKMSQKTADFAKETLENESLKTQTQMLATAVVQTVLNDKEITTQAATFLQEASNAPETQAAFYQLTMHVLQHPETLAELTVLSKKLVNNLSEDPEVTSKLTKIFTQVLADPELKDAVIRLISELSGDPAVIAATSQLCLDLMVRDDVKEATTKLMTESSYEVLEDNEVNVLSKEFVADVMRDAQLQKEGGDALMNSLTHALKPGVVKITGMSLICVSVAVFKLMLSPY